MIMENKRDIFICGCHSVEHSIIVTYFKNDSHPKEAELFIHYHLESKSFWRRVRSAFNHIIGKKSKYGDFGEVIIEATDENIVRLKKMVKFLEENKILNSQRPSIKPEYLKERGAKE